VRLVGIFEELPRSYAYLQRFVVAQRTVWQVSDYMQVGSGSEPAPIPSWVDYLALGNSLAGDSITVKTVLSVSGLF